MIIQKMPMGAYRSANGVAASDIKGFIHNPQGWKNKSEIATDRKPANGNHQAHGLPRARAIQ